MKKVKVRIVCKCGETYILRGILSHNECETGFKRCICGNEYPNGFIIEIVE